jgi:hypothetical protein
MSNVDFKFLIEFDLLSSNVFTRSGAEIRKALLLLVLVRKVLGHPCLHH